MGIVSLFSSLFQKKSNNRPVGEVKWFSNSKGYGFIRPLDGSPDVFVHISAVTRAGFRTLNKGQHVYYDTEKRDGRISAINLESK